MRVSVQADHGCVAFCLCPLGRGGDDFEHAVRQEAEQDERVMELELVEGSVATAAAAALASAATKAKVEDPHPTRFTTS